MRSRAAPTTTEGVPGVSRTIHNRTLWRPGSARSAPAARVSANQPSVNKRMLVCAGLVSLTRREARGGLVRDDPEMDPVVIRRAQATDRDQLWPVVQDFAASFVPERSAFDRSWDLLIEREDTLLLVAERRGVEIVGYLLASHHGTLFANAHVAWVEELMVVAPARRSGIGRALMAEAERWAMGVPVAYISLATRRAEAFYDSLGYERSAAFLRKTLGSSGAR
jgi:GNAT superfamily N-acetyltransferase